MKPDYTGAGIDLSVRMESWDRGEMGSTRKGRRQLTVRWNVEFRTGFQTKHNRKHGSRY
jgi:hypothetical protein